MTMLLNVCFCMDLDRGVIILGWLGIILNMPVTVMMFMLFASRQYFFENHFYLTPLCIGSVASSCIQIFSNILLIIGDKNRTNHWNLLPWMVINKISLILLVITTIFLGIEVADKIHFSVFIALSANYAILIYFWFCVVSLFQRIVRNNERSSTSDILSILEDSQEGDTTLT